MMNKNRNAPFAPPVYQGDQDENIRAQKPTPLTRGREDNRGHRPSEGSGVVEGSGASAGGGGNPEDYDSDSAGGGHAQESGAGRRQMTDRKSQDSDTPREAEAQSGTGGGNLARDVGSRDEERTAAGGDPEPTRVTKQDKVQPDTGTRSDNEGAQTSDGS